MRHLYRSARPPAPRLFALALTLGALTLAGCDSNVDVTGGQSAQLTDQEAAVAASLVGQAVSDQSEGMISDLYDMDAGLDATGLAYTEGPVLHDRFRGGFGGREWRGGLRQDGRVTYDSTTGTHRLRYERRIETPSVEKRLSADLAYVFTDAGGAFVRFPRRDRDRIASITFDGTREGEVEIRTPRRDDRGGSSDDDGLRYRAEFRREATWTLAGLTGASATFAGDQTSEGEVRGKDPRDTTAYVDQEFTVRLRTNGVTITKANAAGGVEAAVTGTLDYEVLIERVVNGQTEEKRASGTIDLQGNGRALLRFIGLDRPYRLDLATGEARREG